ncbi:serine hydrolase domain-containing protein [Plantactinospora sp. CA-294935]|uniref:serine hydrolase domain-containing protein n=1 Tax=Plantactinospora sp. CA-294935 TaxID=3240012 RepID=UPI003D89E795
MPSADLHFLDDGRKVTCRRTHRRVPVGIRHSGARPPTDVAALAALSLSPASPGAHATVQDALDRTVNNAGAPGIVAEVIRGRSRWFGSAGLSDTATGRARTSYEQFRIGSATKAFTATVVLQLAAEHRIGLDDTVEQWLPGLVQGNGYDGRAVTIRQLLNHTSGIFAYTNAQEFFVNGIGAAWYEHRYDRYTPAQLVKVALAHPPYAAPGERFVYSNSNYILAAMIVEKVTGRTFAQEIDRRIVRPLGLTGTYLPATGDAGIRGPHPVHYSPLFSADPNPQIHDATAPPPPWWLDAFCAPSSLAEAASSRGLRDGSLHDPSAERPHRVHPTRQTTEPGPLPKRGADHGDDEAKTRGPGMAKTRMQAPKTTPDSVPVRRNRVRGQASPPARR